MRLRNLVTDEELKALLQVSQDPPNHESFQLDLTTHAIELSPEQLAFLEKNQFLELNCSLVFPSTVYVNSAIPAEAFIIANNNKISLQIRIKSYVK